MLLVGRQATAGRQRVVGAGARALRRISERDRACSLVGDEAPPSDHLVPPP